MEERPEDRADVLRLVRPSGVGIELGVSRGLFSELLLKQNHLSYLYGVDAYGDARHREDKYLAALARLVPYRSQHSLLRLRFTEAARLFPDGYFDFVYIDGCAGSGQEGGRTLREWWPKVRQGGIFAGHDYAPKWPRVIVAVDRFAGEMSRPVHLVGGTETAADPQNRFASWLMVR
jgi:hypothetical protein